MARGRPARARRQHLEVGRERLLTASLDEARADDSTMASRLTSATR